MRRRVFNQVNEGYIIRGLVDDLLALKKDMGRMFIGTSDSSLSRLQSRRKIQTLFQGQTLHENIQDLRLVDSTVPAKHIMGYVNSRFGGYSATVRSALALKIFSDTLIHNELKEAGTLASEVASLVAHEHRLSKGDNPLPTIGFELEFPTEWLHPNQQNVLNEFGLKAKMEGFSLKEINPGPSYSYQPQFTILNYLSKIGIRRDGQTKKIFRENRNPLSLHVNLGGKDYQTTRSFGDVSGPSNAFVDLLTYSFSSLPRILSRKTSRAYYWKEDAEKTKKNDRNNSVRFELRTLEHNGDLAYHAMFSAQVLGSVFLPYVYSKYRRLGEKARNLAEIWPYIEAEVDRLNSKFGLSPNLVDHKELFRGTVGSSQKFEALQKDARKVVEQYINYIRNVLERSGWDL